MKRTPTLEFLHDDSIDTGFRIGSCSTRNRAVSVGTELDQWSRSCARPTSSC